LVDFIYEKDMFWFELHGGKKKVNLMSGVDFNVWEHERLSTKRHAKPPIIQETCECAFTNLLFYSNLL
jgi:hypothetical protein